MSLQKRLFSLLGAADLQWQQRQRKITTASIFSVLTSCSIRRRGIDHILKEHEKRFSAQAIGRARAKLPEDLFRDMNRVLQVRGVRTEPRVFAIDGSKVHIHPSFVKDGYKPRTNDKPVSRPAKRPLAMLSSMLDVHTKTCFDAVVTPHFDERAAARELLSATIKGDTLLFDRGYYSKELAIAAQQGGVSFVFRLRRTAFGGALRFFNSPMTTLKVLLRGADGTLLRARLVKYYIDGKKYMCLTNVKGSRGDIKALYAKRWAVETSFRRLKTDLNLEVAHSMSAAKYIQEIQARILIDTFAMLSQTELLSQTATLSLKHAQPVVLKGYHYFVDGFLAFVKELAAFFDTRKSLDNPLHFKTFQTLIQNEGVSGFGFKRPDPYV
jgi:hypothetical protein